MYEQPVSLRQLMMALSLEDGKSIMRALRFGATITCRQIDRMGEQSYVLQGRVNDHSVMTLEHRKLGRDIVLDLNARLEPFLPHSVA